MTGVVCASGVALLMDFIEGVLPADVSAALEAGAAILPAALAMVAVGVGGFALREPPLFADCDGAELLAGAGVEVVELPALAAAVRTVNSHLLR